MTPDQMATEIDRLRAELAEERTERRRMAETIRVMAEQRARQEAIEAEQKAVRRERNARHRSKVKAASGTETSHETHTETSRAPSPLLDGAPPLPAPISPPPLSSPHPLSSFAAPADAAPLAAWGQAPLFVPPKPAAQPEKPKKPKREPTGDARHGPLISALCAPEFRYTFRGGHDAKAVSELLALADANPATRGEAAPAEIIRRWRICRAWVGFPTSPHLAAFAANWNAYADPQSTSGGNPRAPVRAESQPQFDPKKPAVTVLEGRDAFKEWCP
jgi:hypothetical protein